MIDADWIPKEKGYSLYIRTSPTCCRERAVAHLPGPTLIGTQAQLGVGPNSDALLFVICSPVSEPFLVVGLAQTLMSRSAHTTLVRCFPPKRCWMNGLTYLAGFKPVSLLATTKYTRAWPGGSGGYKLGAK